jgi:hypothetical protein
MVDLSVTSLLTLSMNYSDEPNVIRNPRSSRRATAWIALAAVFAGFIVLAGMWPTIHEMRKARVPHGPNHGSVYWIQVEGQRVGLEIGRVENQLALFFSPMPARPEELTARLVWKGPDRVHEFEMPWNPEGEYFGPTSEGFHPMGDYKLQLSLLRGDRAIWKATRWAYGEDGHHH